MARKTASMLPSRQKAAQRGSWAAVGGDTSMSSLAFCAIGFDGMSGKMSPVEWIERRWTTEQDDYLGRLADSVKAYELVLDCLNKMWVIDPLNVYIAVEEPVPLGMLNNRKIKMDSGWVKQQCEVSGAVLGSLYRYGFTNLFQINNQQWKKVIRDEGTKIRAMPEGKWDIKEWAIQAYGLPDLADLVKAKDGSKIVRPETGFGAKAKPTQPRDIYDAAACMAWMTDHVERVGLVKM